MRLRRELVAACGAVALHAVAFACLAHTRPAWDPAIYRPADLDVELEETPTVATQQEALAPASSDPATIHEAASEVAETPQARPTAAPPPVASASPSAQSTEFAAPFSVTNPSLANARLSLPQGAAIAGAPLTDTPSLPSRPLAPDGTPDVAPGIRRSMQDALREGDHAMGLDVGGPLVAVAEDMVRPSDTPVDSHAVFEIVVDGAGNVTGVTLVGANAGRPSWERVASKLAVALRSKKLTMRGHGGAVVTLSVDSRWTMPSGGRAGHPVSPPTSVDPVTGEPCGVASSGCVASTGFDITDLATRPGRQVHARVVTERYP